MSIRRYYGFFLLITGLFLIECKTTKPIPEALQGNESAFQTEAKGFSPNGDGFADEILFSLFVGKAELLKSWDVEIRSGTELIRTFSGPSPAPQELFWEGKNDAGTAAAEKTYVALMRLFYTDTDIPLELSSKSFVLTLTPPEAKILIDPLTGISFAPGGAVSAVALSVSGISSVASTDSWNLNIIAPDGKSFKRFFGKGPSAHFIWDGKNGSGKAVGPGSLYSAVLTVRDEFGLEGKTTGVIPVGDLSFPDEQSQITTQRSGFSPTTMTMKNTLELLLSFGDKNFIKSWTVTIVSPTGGVKREIKGDSSLLPASVLWDGKDGNETPVPDGKYYATLSLDYGNAFKSIIVKSPIFEVSTMAPKGILSIDPSELEFDGKGGLNSSTIKIKPFKSGIPISSWVLSIASSSGFVIADFAGIWPTDSVEWNGRDKAGAVAEPEKEYTLTALINDEYGNTGTFTGKITVGILPEVDEPSAVQFQTKGFSPNGDGAMDRMVLGLSYGNSYSLETWKLEILETGKGINPVKNFSGDIKHLPSSISWDGIMEDGKPAEEGSYQARFSVTYGKTFAGVQVFSAPFLLDVTAPKIKITASPALFSPDGDGYGDIETFKILPVGKESDIAIWMIDVYDPAGNFFAGFNGEWPTDSVTWDGKGITGDLVESAEDYLVVARIMDQFGNTAEIKKNLPTDILVIKTDKGYRIRIASIVFKAFTADYIHVAPDRAKRNLATLSLLGGKLKKFSEYGIRITGHAVMVYWDNPSAGMREQEAVLLPLSKARAEAVKTALSSYGIKGERIETEGVGARDQVVPDSDLANRWKNRRVEFFLEK